MVKYKKLISSMVVRPEKFSNDLLNFYLNGYLVSEIRDIFTQREREQFFAKGSAPRVSNPPKCQRAWPICYKDIEKRKVTAQHSVTVFRSEFVLSNFKPDYFAKLKQAKEQEDMLKYKGTDGLGGNAEDHSFRMHSKKAPASSTLAAQLFAQSKGLEIEDDSAISEEDLLMVRQAHICDCRDEHKDKMIHDFKLMLSKQIANYSVPDKVAVSPAGKRTSRISGESFNTEIGLGLFRKKTMSNSKYGSNFAKDGSQNSRKKRLMSKDGTQKQSPNTNNDSDREESYPDPGSTRDNQTSTRNIVWTTVMTMTSRSIPKASIFRLMHSG